MQENSHPTLHTVQVTCTCGNKFDFCSAADKKTLNIESCNKCHPAYTGKRRSFELNASRRFAEKYKGHSAKLTSSLLNKEKPSKGSDKKEQDKKE
jgi:ribosomal protein L31